MFEFNSKGYLKKSKSIGKIIRSRQESPKVFEVNGLYINAVTSLLKTKDMFKGNILPYVISDMHGFMIDTEFDFFIAENISKILEKNKKF